MSNISYDEHAIIRTIDIWIVINFMFPFLGLKFPDNIVFTSNKKAWISRHKETALFD